MTKNTTLIIVNRFNAYVNIVYFLQTFRLYSFIRKYQNDGVKIKIYKQDRINEKNYQEERSKDVIQRKYS